MTRRLWLVLAIVSSLPVWLHPKPAGEPDYAKTLAAIAREIEALKAAYPELESFSAAKAMTAGRLMIDYEYHCDPPPRTGGWTGGVPAPRADGVWFFLDFHDPDSPLQVHTQPIVATSIPVGRKVAFLLIREGNPFRGLEGHLWEIVRRHARHPEF